MAHLEVLSIVARLIVSIGNLIIVCYCLNVESIEGNQYCTSVTIQSISFLIECG